nr:hypothetical protein [Tanacetum cinerariifolium]
FTGYFPASPGNISPNSSNDLTKYLLTSLAISPYHNDLYIIQAYDSIPPPQAIIALPAVVPLSLDLHHQLGQLHHHLTIPLMSYLSGRGMKPLESKPDLEEPNESDACYNVHLWK